MFREEEEISRASDLTRITFIVIHATFFCHQQLLHRSVYWNCVQVKRYKCVAMPKEWKKNGVRLCFSEINSKAIRDSFEFIIVARQYKVCFTQNKHHCKVANASFYTKITSQRTNKNAHNKNKPTWKFQ